MTLLLVFGPPAVGKMTVGRAIADAGGFRLFHNHHVIEPLLDVFEFETPAFQTLLGEFRQRVLEEAAAADVDLVFTLVWALELDEDAAAIRHHLAPFIDAGRRVVLVELCAGLETRLARNRTPYRLAEKKSKRDVAFSRSNLLDLEENYVMNTSERRTIGEDLFAGRDHLRVDNTRLDAAEAAKQIAAELGI